jgi:hypothetical protein
MIFQEAIRNGKAKANPARLVRLHREDNSRVRFITYPEEAIIRAIIRERCPIHEPELTLISANLFQEYPRKMGSLLAFVCVGLRQGRGKYGAIAQ